MDISKRLYRYPSLMDEVEDLKSQIDGIMVERYNVKVTSTITGMPGGGKTSDPVYQTVEKIVGNYDTKLMQSYKKINELLEEHNAISMALWKLDLDQRKIIEMRFLNVGSGKRFRGLRTFRGRSATVS